MKIKIYLLRFVIAFTAFIFSIVFFNVWQSVNSATQTKNPESVASQSASQPKIAVIPSTVAEMPVIETSSAPDLKAKDEYEFDAAGEYYAVNDDLPIHFEDFEIISIVTKDYTDATYKNRYRGVVIPPKAFILAAKKEYKFTRINIANRQIAFETEARKGISYKFVGKFVDSSQRSEDDYADLEGRLIKMRDGKKIAETIIRLAVAGC